MPLSSHQLHNLPVYTRLGQHLGKVVGFEVDGDTQRILRYHVRSTDLIRRWLGNELLIGYQQVISLTEEKMVVEDNVVRDEEAKAAIARAAATN